LLIDSEISGPCQLAALKLLEDFLCHRRDNGGAGKEQLLAVVGKLVADSVQCALGCFPVLICSGWINSAFKFSAGEIELAIFEKLSSWPSVWTFQENHVDVLPNQPRLSVEQNEMFAPRKVGDLIPLLLMLDGKLPAPQNLHKGLGEFPLSESACDVPHLSAKRIASR